MGEARHTKNRIAGLEAVITQHLAKIGDELALTNPNYGRVAHWEREIRGWQKEIARLEERLNKRRRRG